MKISHDTIINDQNMDAIVQPPNHTGLDTTPRQETCFGWIWKRKKKTRVEYDVLKQWRMGRWEELLFLLASLPTNVFEFKIGTGAPLILLSV